MAKSKNVQRISNKKRGRPKVRFSIWGMIIIFALSFISCFVLYMVAANFNDDFFTEEFDNIIVEEETTVSANDEPQQDSASDEEAVETVTSASETVSITNPVPQSAAVDASYFDNCCLVTDSTLLDIGSCTDLNDVIGSYKLSASGCNTMKVDTNYGTVTVYETLQIKKPMNVYIMLGSDIGAVSVDDMISNYSTLVSNLHSYSPDMHIYIMQLPPVIADTDTVTNELINEYNTKLLNMANNIGVYCIDTNTALKSVDGNLSEEYWSAETGTLSEAAYNAVTGYILTHTV